MDNLFHLTILNFSAIIQTNVCVLVRGYGNGQPRNGRRKAKEEEEAQKAYVREARGRDNT
jgi:hypothetical protein